MWLKYSKSCETWTTCTSGRDFKQNLKKTFLSIRLQNKYFPKTMPLFFGPFLYMTKKNYNIFQLDSTEYKKLNFINENIRKI